MNVYAPMTAYTGAGQSPEASSAFAGFARAGAQHVRRLDTRLSGIVAVVAIHAFVLAAYVFAGPAFLRAPPTRLLTVVNVLAEPPKPEEPPPMPKLAPPEVYVPVPVVPEIQLAVPPPPRDAITIPPTATASPPNAPFVPASPAPPPPPPKPALSASDQAAFAGRLFAHLNRFKHYPEGAKLRHQEGIVSLRFVMDRNGHVISFEIAKGSGSAALDAEARELLQRAQPLPPIPVEFGRETLDLIVPVEFSLH